MRIDEELIRAMAIGIGAAAEMALRNGWDEAAFLKLSGLVFRHERDGSSSEQTGRGRAEPAARPAESGGCPRA